MQRTEIGALLAGTTLGMGGGALGAFFVCMAGRALAHRLFDESDSLYIELRQAASQARHYAQQPSPGCALTVQPGSDQSLQAAVAGGR